MKIFYAQQLLHGGGMLSSRWMLSLAVGTELSIAALIWSCRPLVAHRVALVAFSVFGVIASAAWLTETDCNCFGPRTTKGLPALIDAACLLGLILARRSARATDDHHPVQEEELGRPFWRHDGDSRSSFFKPLFTTVVAGLIGSALAWVAAGHATHRPHEIPGWLGENIVGDTLPLLRLPIVQAIVPTDEKRLLVLLRPDCDHCREFAQRWNADPPSGIAPQQVVGVAIVPSVWTLMPGVVSAEASPQPNGHTLNWNDVREPFVATPTLIAIDGGRVSSVVSGKDADAKLDSVTGILAMFALEKDGG